MYLFHVVMHVGLWEITIQNYNVEQTERLSLTDSASSLPAITPMHNQNMLAFTVMLKVLESQYYKYHTLCVCVYAYFFAMLVLCDYSPDPLTLSSDHVKS